MNEIFNIIGDGRAIIAVKISDTEVYLHNSKSNEVVSCWDILAAACDAESNEVAWNILRFASKLFHPSDNNTFNALYDAAVMSVNWNHKHRNDCHNGNGKERK